jgi:hypothetical protein
VAPEKLAMEEFQCLSELGKYSKDEQFKVTSSGESSAIQIPTRMN